MGRRGPRPTPTAKLAARGSWRAKTKERRAEPKPTGGAPPRPDWLLPEGAEEWDRVAPELLAQGLLTSVDWSQFAAYCQSFAHWVRAEAFLAEHGTVYTVRDDKGVVKFTGTVPQWSIAQKALEKMRAFAREFGLSPAARVGLPGKPVEDPQAAELARILGGGPALKVTG